MQQSLKAYYRYQHQPTGCCDVRVSYQPHRVTYENSKRQALLIVYRSRVKRSFYSGSAKIIWLQPILFVWLLKGRSSSSERARFHCWPSGWQTWLAIYLQEKTECLQAYRFLDLLYLAQKFASSLNLCPPSWSSFAASLSSWETLNMDFYSLESLH